MPNTKGIIFVISAPSGGGKTSLVKALLKKDANLTHPVSFTTRPPRRKEKNGRDYHFISDEEFKKRLTKGDFLEWSRPFGQRYATPSAAILRSIRRGRNVVLNLDVRGASFIKKKFKDAVLIYVLPPSLNALRKRLIGRSTDDSREITKRFRLAKKDIANLNKYDYAVVNDKFGEAVSDLQAILIAEKFKVR
ncbi:MAG: guanylate kinase [Candidatus Omnitrophota bacterium]|nr:guanylate kinase [Candidatus Omnitrophota bacterium]